MRFVRLGLAAALLCVVFACGAEESRDTGPADVASTDEEGAPDSTAPEIRSDTVVDTGADSAPVLVGEVTLPPYPWWANEAFSISTERLGEMANEYCAGGQAENAEDFFYRDMPLHAVAGLCEADEATVKELLGLMYLSGWYGGLWFRDHAGFGMGGDGSEGGPPSGPVLMGSNHAPPVAGTCTSPRTALSRVSSMRATRRSLWGAE